jgi:hypothetical protein
VRGVLESWTKSDVALAQNLDSGTLIQNLLDELEIAEGLQMEVSLPVNKRKDIDENLSAFSNKANLSSFKNQKRFLKRATTTDRYFWSHLHKFTAGNTLTKVDGANSE